MKREPGDSVAYWNEIDAKREKRMKRSRDKIKRDIKAGKFTKQPDAEKRSD